jgi:hypothetical protein
VDDGERTTGGLPVYLTRQDSGGRGIGGTQAQVDVWSGLDVGKGEHFADVLNSDGERLREDRSNPSQTMILKPESRKLPLAGQKPYSTQVQ